MVHSKNPKYFGKEYQQSDIFDIAQWEIRDKIEQKSQ